MYYEPITDETKDQWIQWLQEQVKELNGKKQQTITRELLGTEEGDLANMKDMVGITLATLLQQKVQII